MHKTRVHQNVRKTKVVDSCRTKNSNERQANEKQTPESDKTKKRDEKDNGWSYSVETSQREGIWWDNIKCDCGFKSVFLVEEHK